MPVKMPSKDCRERTGQAGKTKHLRVTCTSRAALGPETPTWTRVGDTVMCQLGRRPSRAMPSVRQEKPLTRSGRTDDKASAKGFPSSLGCAHSEQAERTSSLRENQATSPTPLRQETLFPALTLKAGTRDPSSHPLALTPFLGHLQSHSLF